MSFFQMPNPIAARRLFLGHSGFVLSGAAVALVWNDKTLDRFLTQPLKLVPGSAMTRRTAPT